MLIGRRSARMRFFSGIRPDFDECVLHVSCIRPRWEAGKGSDAAVDVGHEHSRFATDGRRLSPKHAMLVTDGGNPARAVASYLEAVLDLLIERLARAASVVLHGVIRFIPAEPGAGQAYRFVGCVFPASHRRRMSASELEGKTARTVAPSGAVSA